MTASNHLFPSEFVPAAGKAKQAVVKDDGTQDLADKVLQAVSAYRGGDKLGLCRACITDVYASALNKVHSELKARGFDVKVYGTDNGDDYLEILNA